MKTNKLVAIGAVLGTLGLAFGAVSLYGMYQLGIGHIPFLIAWVLIIVGGIVIRVALTRKRRRR